MPKPIAPVIARPIARPIGPPRAVAIPVPDKAVPMVVPDNTPFKPPITAVDNAVDVNLTREPVKIPAIAVLAPPKRSTSPVRPPSS